jgi:hypothetical protein
MTTTPTAHGDGIDYAQRDALRANGYRTLDGVTYTAGPKTAPTATATVVNPGAAQWMVSAVRDGRNAWSIELHGVPTRIFDNALFEAATS